MCNKPSWDEVNENLLKKGWDYYNSSKGDDTHYSTIIWSFNKNAYSDKAQGWLHLYTYEDQPNKITYSFFNKASYNTIKGGITAAGLKLIDNSIDDNEITSKYANARFIATIKTGKREKEEDSYDDNSIIEYTVSIVKKSGIYDSDNGLKKVYDDGGNLASEYTLKDGSIVGIRKSYHPNGKVSIISTYVEGKPQGPSKEYDEDGNLYAEYNYANGEISGPYKIYEKGKLKLMGSLLLGNKNGLFKVFDESGNLDSEYTMKDDSLDGFYKAYYYNNNKLSFKVIGQYANGTKTGLWQSEEINENRASVFDYHTYMDGEYNGAFKEVTNDSIIFGTYRDGMLHGQYKIFTSLHNLILGDLSGDTSGTILTTSGNYFNGQKIGNWKYFSLTKALRVDGQYSNDEKTGEWRLYLDFIQNEGKAESYSNQLYKIENYEKGKLNGKSVQYANLEKVVVPCDTVRNKNPLDTCYTMKYQKMYEMVFYKNDVFHGPCEIKDSVGNIQFQGTFINGEKDGPWIERYDRNSSEGVSYSEYLKGNYIKGKRNGIWDECGVDNFVYTNYNYKNGLLEGKTIDLNRKNKPKTEKFFEKGRLKGLNSYDSLGSSLQAKYEILSESPIDLKCRLTDYNNDGSTSQVYWMKKNEESINHNYFEIEFLFKISDKFSDGSSGYADGEFKAFDSHDLLLVEGAVIKKDRIGKWKYYYRDVNVLVEQEYSNNIGGCENYYNLSTGQPFSGKFIQLFTNGKLKSEFKISDGLRDGKSKYYNENGEIVKTEKYDKGVID